MRQSFEYLELKWKNENDTKFNIRHSSQFEIEISRFVCILFHPEYIHVSDFCSDCFFSSLNFPIAKCWPFETWIFIRISYISLFSVSSLHNATQLPIDDVMNGKPWNNSNHYSIQSFLFSLPLSILRTSYTLRWAWARNRR